MSTLYVPDTLQGTGHTKINTLSCSHGAHVLAEKTNDNIRGPVFSYGSEGA